MRKEVRAYLQNLVQKLEDLRDAEEPGQVTTVGHERKDGEDHVAMGELLNQRESVILGSDRRGEGSEDLEVFESVLSLGHQSDQDVLSFGRARRAVNR